MSVSLSLPLSFVSYHARAIGVFDKGKNVIRREDGEEEKRGWRREKSAGDFSTMRVDVLSLGFCVFFRKV